jgi:acetyl esterase/lipase
MLWDEKNSMNDNMAAIIHNHGGGGVKGTMWDNLEGLFYRDLMKEDFVIFLVDYRLAPQYKSPAGQTDCY